MVKFGLIRSSNPWDIIQRSKSVTVGSGWVGSSRVGVNLGEFICGGLIVVNSSWAIPWNCPRWDMDEIWLVHDETVHDEIISQLNFHTRILFTIKLARWNYPDELFYWWSNCHTIKLIMMHLHRLNCERCNFHDEIISQWDFHTRKLFTTKLPRWNILQMIMLSHDYFTHDEFTSIKSRPMLFPRLNRLKTGQVGLGLDRLGWFKYSVSYTMAVYKTLSASLRSELQALEIKKGNGSNVYPVQFF